MSDGSIITRGAVVLHIQRKPRLWGHGKCLREGTSWTAPIPIAIFVSELRMGHNRDHRWKGLKGHCVLDCFSYSIFQKLTLYSIVLYWFYSTYPFLGVPKFLTRLVYLARKILKKVLPKVSSVAISPLLCHWILVGSLVNRDSPFLDDCNIL